MYQITLKMARLNSGMTLEEAAKVAEISPSTLIEWERDGGQAELYPALKLLHAYGISINHVRFAKEEEVISEFLKNISKVVA